MLLQNILLLLPVLIQSEYVANQHDRRLKKTVIPPYQTAVTLLNNDIVGKLMNIHSIRGQRQLSTLSNGLYCTAQQIFTNLEQATSANDELKEELDSTTVELARRISQTEDEKKRIQQNFVALQGKISSLQNAIYIAERAVNDKEEDYRAAQRAHQQAEEALDDAHYCIRRKRRWTWFERNILEPLNDVGVAVWRGACSIVNSGGISNAEHRVSVARTSLDEARNSLTNHRNQLSVAYNVKTSVEYQLSSINHRLVIQNEYLEEQRAEHTLTIKLSVRFKEIKVHLNTISIPSEELLKELNMLIAFDDLIKPLNEIYKELSSEHLIEDETLKISPSQVKETTRKLKWLAKKLPLVDLLHNQLQRPCDLKNNDLITYDNEIESNQTNWSQEGDQEASDNETFLFDWDNTKDILMPGSNFDETTDSEALPSEGDKTTDFTIPEPNTFTTDDYKSMLSNWYTVLQEIATELNSETLSDDGRRFFEMTKSKIEAQIKTVREHLAKK
ncbi:unnamed protein product [Didymodactylos carnosus]|uniref:Uncharacterized protein n=1 Tax=Didymodactylos carnosus TaxID=1234261 RepID=A0A8S2FCN5_9BILA|nr:unnamed protein product [Didymodactylos carnosus]CAF4225809.1 unnamed protein product [Didymodactylos carnosus]